MNPADRRNGGVQDAFASAIERGADIVEQLFIKDAASRRSATRALSPRIRAARDKAQAAHKF